MNTFLKYFLFISLCFSTFSGCMKETYKGQYQVLNSSREWIPFQGGEKVNYTNANMPGDGAMVYEASKRKSIYNNITDCRSKNIFQDECDVYSMEYNFVTSTSLDKKGTITYSLEKGEENGKFYDELKIRVQYYGNAEMSTTIQVFNETDILEKDCTFVGYPDVVSLGGKIYTDVYMKKSGKQSIFFTKKLGVVAFSMNGTDTWVRI